MFGIIDRPKRLGNDTIYGEKAGCNREVYKRETCKTCGYFTSVRQVSDLCIEIFGTQLDHFVWIDGWELIVNEELHDLLEKSDLSGFEFRNVEIVVWGGDVVPSDQLPKLFQVVVKGKGGSIFPQNVPRARFTCKDCGITRWELLDQVPRIKAEQSKSTPRGAHPIDLSQRA